MNRYGYNFRAIGPLAAMIALAAESIGSVSSKAPGVDRSCAPDADDVAIIDSMQSGSPSAEPATRPAPQGNRAQRRAQKRRR